MWTAGLRRQLEESKDRSRYLESLLGGIQDAIVSSNANGRIMYWNRAAEKLFGVLSHGEEISILLRRNFSGLDQNLMENIAREQTILDLETVSAKHDGARVNI